ncbi:MAG: hypothetical protein HRT86_05540, partial [Ilumatobacteraceae bacterium]|nr:hypothetical protein [Ilumatobacteraceae bacterium]
LHHPRRHPPPPNRLPLTEKPGIPCAKRTVCSQFRGLSRKQFGIEFNVPLGGDKVMIFDKGNLELDVQLVAPA